MKRAVRIIAGVFLGLIIAVLAAVLILFNSGEALRLLVSRFSPPGLSIRRVSGTLAGPVIMKGITYSRGENGNRVQIGELYMDWQPLELFALNVHVTRMDIKKMRVRAAKKPAKPAAPKPLPKLRLPSFVSVALDNVSCTDVEYISAASKKPLILDRIKLGAYMQGDTLYIKNLHARTPQYEMAVKGKLRTADDYPLSLKTSWAAAIQKYPKAEGTGSLDGSLENLHILQTIKPPYNTDIDLTLENLARKMGTAPGAPIGWKGKIAWRSLRIFLFAPPGKQKTRRELINSPRGELTSEGDTGAYRLGLDTVIYLPLKPKGKGKKPAGTKTQYIANHIRMEGAGDMESLTVRNFQDAVFGGKLYGRGKVNWKSRPVTGFAFSINAKGINTAKLSPEMPGSINFRTIISGEISKQKRDILLELTGLTGDLRGHPLSGSGRVRAIDKDYFIPGIDIRSGRASLSASGSLVHRRWDFRWDLNAKDIGELAPDAGGAISAKGVFTGTGKPVVRATLAGTDVRYKTYSIKTLASAFAVDLADRQSSNINLTATGLKAGKHQVREIRMTGTGKLARHRITLSAKGLNTALIMSLQGGYAGGAWSGEIGRMDISERKYGTWKLPRPAPLKLAKGAASAYICLENITRKKAGGAAEICLKADVKKPQGMHAALTASRVPLGLFQPLMPPGLTPSGALNGNADIMYSQARVLTGSADIRLSNGAFIYALGGKKVRLSFRQGVLKMLSTPQAAQLGLDLLFVEGGGISGKFVISRPVPQKTAAGIKNKNPNVAAGVKGGLQMNIPNLAIFAAVMPALKNPKGALKAAINVSGPIKNPEITGKLALEKGSATIPRLGLDLTGVNFTAASAGKNRFNITGVLHSGKGEINIAGYLARTPAKTLRADLSMKGSDFQAVKIPEARAAVSPDLRFLLADKTGRLTGSITIPEANVKIKEISGAVKPSPDVVVMGQKKPRIKVAQLKLYTDIKVILGNDINFAGFGLTSSITGNLAIREEPGRIATGLGELVITKGKYKAYGQDLDIKQGKLFYSGGPVDNPGLNIRATRSAQNNVVAGIDVTGTLHSPKLAIFSEPPMDQTDALAYLVLGKPLSSASGSQGNMLYSAATSAGLAGGAFLAKRIGRLFGIQTVSVEKTPQKTTGEQQASLFLGRYLSPRLYVAYGLGIFQASNIFRVRYQLTRDWIVQTETGTETGGDVFYKIEW